MTELNVNSTDGIHSGKIPLTELNVNRTDTLIKMKVWNSQWKIPMDNSNIHLGSCKRNI